MRDALCDPEPPACEIAAGKRVHWLADQLGHANLEFTMRTYAHAMAVEEADLSFSEFADPNPSYTAPVSDDDPASEIATGPE